MDAVPVGERRCGCSHLSVSLNEGTGLIGEAVSGVFGWSMCCIGSCVGDQLLRQGMGESAGRSI